MTAAASETTVVSQETNTTNHDGIPNASTLRSGESDLKKSVSHTWFPAKFEYILLHTYPHMYVYTWLSVCSFK